MNVLEMTHVGDKQNVRDLEHILADMDSPRVRDQI